MLQGRVGRADIPDVEQALIVRRWRRYGADRLYVTAETGAPLGSVDLATGAVAVEPDAAVEGSGVEDAVRGAAQAYLRADVPELVLPASAVLPPEEPEPLPVVDERPRGRRARPEADDDVLHAADRAEARRSGPRGRHRAADALVTPREDGEPRALAESLCDRLDRLVLAGWHVLHDVPVGRQGTVVGHLLVGPPGAFAVAERPAAAAPERFAVDGRSLAADGVALADLRDLRLTAARAGSLLRTAVGSPVAVRGVLVVHGEVDVLRPPPYEAVVVTDEQVPDVFAAMPGHWTPGRVDAVAAIARRRSTWALTWAV